MGRGREGAALGHGRGDNRNGRGRGGNSNGAGAGGSKNEASRGRGGSRHIGRGRAALDGSNVAVLRHSSKRAGTWATLMGWGRGGSRNRERLGGVAAVISNEASCGREDSNDGAGTLGGQQEWGGSVGGSSNDFYLAEDLNFFVLPGKCMTGNTVIACVLYFRNPIIIIKYY